MTHPGPRQPLLCAAMPPPPPPPDRKALKPQASSGDSCSLSLTARPLPAWLPALPHHPTQAWRSTEISSREPDCPAQRQGARHSFPRSPSQVPAQGLNGGCSQAQASLQYMSEDTEHDRGARSPCSVWSGVGRGDFLEETALSATVGGKERLGLGDRTQGCRRTPQGSACSSLGRMGNQLKDWGLRALRPCTQPGRAPQAGAPWPQSSQCSCPCAVGRA